MLQRRRRCRGRSGEERLFAASSRFRIGRWAGRRHRFAARLPRLRQGGVRLVGDLDDTSSLPPPAVPAAHAFVLRDDHVWVQAGVKDGASRRVIATGSPRGKAILARSSGLGTILSDGSCVVLRDQGQTVELSSGT